MTCTTVQPAKLSSALAVVGRLKIILQIGIDYTHILVLSNHKSTTQQFCFYSSRLHFSFTAKVLLLNLANLCAEDLELLNREQPAAEHKRGINQSGAVTRVHLTHYNAVQTTRYKTILYLRSYFMRIEGSVVVNCVCASGIILTPVNGRRKDFFPEGGKNDETCVFPIETKKITFFAEMFKIQGGLGPRCPPSMRQSA